MSQVIKPQRSFVIFLILLVMVTASVWFALKLPTSSNTKMPFSYLKQFDQAQLLLFFGFPQCGDVCPLTLFKLSQLDPQPPVVFVNIDPYSDTAETRSYIEKFDQRFHPWVPDQQQKKMLVNYFPHEWGNSPYRNEHQGRLYLMERDSSGWKLVHSFAADTSIQVLNKYLIVANSGV